MWHDLQEKKNYNETKQGSGDKGHNEDKKK